MNKKNDKLNFEDSLMRLEEIAELLESENTPLEESISLFEEGITLKELCEEKIDFISFGTNDLTQYTLAIDRGNQEVQNLYNELDPSILHQIEHVIKVCKRYKVETSICGQSGSKKEMVKYLVGKGIDSISVNADVAKEISDYVAELEKPPIEEQPRQYQPETDKKIQKVEEIIEDTKKAIDAIEKEKIEYEKTEETKQQSI